MFQAAAAANTGAYIGGVGAFQGAMTAASARGNEHTHSILFNLESAFDGQLSVKQGEAVSLITRHADGWCEVIRLIDGKKGVVPDTYLETVAMQASRAQLEASAAMAKATASASSLGGDGKPVKRGPGRPKGSGKKRGASGSPEPKKKPKKETTYTKKPKTTGSNDPGSAPDPHNLCTGRKVRGGGWGWSWVGVTRTWPAGFRLGHSRNKGAR